MKPKPHEFGHHIKRATEKFVEEFPEPYLRSDSEFTYDPLWKYVQDQGARRRLKELGSKPRDKTNDYSTTRAIGAITAELMKRTGRTKIQNMERELPQLFREAGIRRVLEVGPSRNGLVHILARTGIPHYADLELSAIDKDLSEASLGEMRDLKIDAKVGDANHLEEAFGDKKFDLIVGVGVLSLGGQQGQVEEKLDAHIDASHRISKEMVRALSHNPNAFICAAPVAGALSLDKKKVREFASVAHWSPTSEVRREIMKDHMRRLDGNKEQFLDQSADLVILKKQ